MTSAPCYTCGENPMDFSGASQLKKIQRIVADNITIIVISAITVSLLIVVIWYFYYQLKDTIKKWRTAYAKKKEDIKIVNEDSEVYDEDDYNFDNTKTVEPNKVDFVRSMQIAYKDYNKLKGEYILSNFSKTNDDVIDQSMFYRKYDDYSYKNTN